MTTGPAHPWRRVARTILANLAAFLVVIPIIVNTLGLDPNTYPRIATLVIGITAVTAALTRVLAIPQVDAWLKETISWLSAGDVADSEVAAYVAPDGSVLAGQAIQLPNDSEVVVTPVPIPRRDADAP